MHHMNSTTAGLPHLLWSGVEGEAWNRSCGYSPAELKSKGLRVEVSTNRNDPTETAFSLAVWAHKKGKGAC